MLTNGVKAELLREKLKSNEQKTGMPKEAKDVSLFGDKTAKTSGCKTSESYLVSAQGTLFGNSNDYCAMPSSGSWNDSSLFAYTLDQYNMESYNERMRLYSALNGTYGTCTETNNGFWAQLFTALQTGAIQGLV